MKKSREDKEEDIISDFVKELDLSDARIRKRFLVESTKQQVFQTSVGEQFLEKLAKGEVPENVGRKRLELPWWKRHRKKVIAVGSLLLLIVGTTAIILYTGTMKHGKAMTNNQSDTEYKQLQHMQGTAGEIMQCSSTYVMKESNTVYLDADSFKNMTYEQMNLALYEIYARHGRKFYDINLQAYFEGKSWYVPLAEGAYSDKLLNEIERSNIVVIKEAMDQYENEYNIAAYDYSSLTIDDMKQCLKEANLWTDEMEQKEDSVIRAMYYDLMEAGYLVNGELTMGQVGTL